MAPRPLPDGPRALAWSLAVGAALCVPRGACAAPGGADYVFPVTREVPPELSTWFDRGVRVFGVHVFASAATEAWALQHVARSLAQYLDQDEDGTPDDPEVVRQLVAHRGAMVVTRTEQEYNEGVARVADKAHSTLAHGTIKNDHPVWNCSVSDVWVYAEIFQEECARDATEPYGQVPPHIPYFRVDGTWEEIFHLITHVGYGCAYPEIWGFRADASRPFGYPGPDVPSSNISRALDAMLGDCGAAYNGTQTPRHDGQCGYHYEDESCFYPCLVNEYLHTVHLAAVGALDALCTKDIEEEYFYCTQALSRFYDPAGFALGGSPMLPQKLPSGHYRPSSLELLGEGSQPEAEEGRQAAAAPSAVWARRPPPLPFQLATLMAGLAPAAARGGEDVQRRLETRFLV